MSEAGSRGEILAAIDVGSNSIRLLIARWDPQLGLQMIDESRAQPRLATGVARHGTIDKRAMNEALAALGMMAAMIERHGASQIVAVATSAVREASNGAEFVTRVRDETGIALEIIDADREARLSWRSVTEHFQLDDERTVVADIGGGSLELVAAVDGLVQQTITLPLGAVRLTELHLLNERKTAREVDAMRRAARSALKKALPWRDWRRSLLIGSGGSFTSLARMVTARRRSNAPVHGMVVTAGETETLLRLLASRSSPERARTPGLSPERADIILAGLAVMAELMERLEVGELTVSEFGLREGLLLELVDQSRDDADPASDRLRPLREFVARCRGDLDHVEQVRTLAVSLFDQLGDELGCKAEERWFLEAAALLHDVGQVVAYKRHHRHSYQLIMHAERLGLAARERSIIAVASRYHRKSGPSLRHEEFAALNDNDQEVVRRVSALLRVADGLDRGHAAAVGGVRVKLGKHRCKLVITAREPGADLSLERWGAESKQDVLETVLGCEVEIR